MAARKKESVKKVTEKKEKVEKKSVSPEDAIRLYQKDPSFNEAVANGTMTEQQEEYAKVLDEAMKPIEKTELNRITIMATIEPYLEQTGVSKVMELQGRQITYVPYMSTSRKPLKTMLEYRYHLGLNAPVCVVVHTEGKVLGIDVNGILGANEAFSEAREVIIKRGQEFLVRTVGMGDGWGEAYPVIELYPV